ncbi:unnamed protein product [Arctogadus glacialis]
MTTVMQEAEAAARILLDSGTVHVIETPHGPLRVTVQCTTTARRPAILTVHDVGLDSQPELASLPLQCFDEMQEILPVPLLMDTISEDDPSVRESFNAGSGDEVTRQTREGPSTPGGESSPPGEAAVVVLVVVDNNNDSSRAKARPS